MPKVYVNVLDFAMTGEASAPMAMAAVASTVAFKSLDFIVVKSLQELPPREPRFGRVMD